MTSGASSTLSKGHRALRRGRHSIAGQIYLVTTVCLGRHPTFADHHAARVASRALHSTATLRGAHCLAWVAMPDHVHLLLRLGEGVSLSKAVMHLKTNVARQVNRETARSGSLWQRGFHDRALREDEDVRDAARYIVANPLRAGLAESVGEYPYWDAVWLD
ncbi:REP-associated tyrosine transposase [Pseudomarimonas salicorniae]|uniref:Transposase n=1 Tax=Pseudomarimonas salicorniae TaxID=2933270 RepID=A0ABT0GLF7_9GAMM|nr:transposase [Lysobacter sp. CAU 1642]MCK7595217.1 transposase [Lysobacter sp. CAU 1642]